jgi:hypothetical protein
MAGYEGARNAPGIVGGGVMRSRCGVVFVDLGERELLFGGIPAVYRRL